MEASAEELEAVNEVGPKVAQAIVEFFADEANRELVERLREGWADDDGGEEGDRHRARGADVCADRHAADADARRGEGKDRGRRRQGLGQRQQEDRLCGGRRRGRSKLDKAQSLGVKVLDEAGLLEMLGGDPSPYRKCAKW